MVPDNTSSSTKWALVHVEMAAFLWRTKYLIIFCIVLMHKYFSKLNVMVNSILQQLCRVLFEFLGLLYMAAVAIFEWLQWQEEFQSLESNFRMTLQDKII